jgi:hypothetical protein
MCKEKEEAMGKIIQPAEDLNVLFSDFLNLFSERKEDRSVSMQDIDYLQRGERIETLAREVYQKRMASYTLSELEQKIFSVKFEESMSYMDIVHKMSKTFTRPLLKSMVKCDDAFASILVDSVKEFFKIKLSFVNGYTEGSTFRCAKKVVGSAKDKVDGDVLLQIEVEEKGFPAVSFMGWKNTSHTKKVGAWTTHTGELLNYVDLADCISSMIVYSQVMKYIQRFNSDDSARETDPLYVKFKDVLDTSFEQNVHCSFSCFGTSEKPNCVDDLADYTWYFSSLFEYSVSKDPLYKRLCIDGQSIISASNATIMALRKGNVPGKSVLVHSFDDLASFYLLKYPDVFSYRRLLTNGSSNFVWGLPLGYSRRGSSKVFDSSSMELLKELFLIVNEEKVEQKQLLDYYNDLNGKPHAKSYQNKKAVPQRVLSAMEKSVFNEYFGFVEFDEETDTDKAEEIALEFKALKDAYFQDIDSSSNSIRFRKLGNHKALGLYYPVIKCLCVDIHSPSSLVHEYGHLIDYMHGDLSRQLPFMPVKEAYLRYLNEQMERNKSVKATMTKGNSKYNYKYYSQSTEIFARSFELYVANVLGVVSSIVPDTFNPMVYPDTEDFLEEIAKYFNALFDIKMVTYSVHCKSSEKVASK